MKISVVLACYNGGKFIRAQLDSILQQTTLVDEIIIVDDGSTDNTIEIISEYVSIHNNIKFLKNSKNVGVIKTFEKALLCSSGDYILFSDQDDVWCINKVEILLENIGDNLLIYSDTYITDSKLNITGESGFKYFEKDRNFNSLLDYFMGNNITGCTMMISKTLLQVSLPFPDINIMYHDQYLGIIAKKNNKLIQLRQQLVYYRQHASNQSGGVGGINLDIFLNNSYLMAKDLKLISSYINFDKHELNELDTAIDFFYAMAHKKYPSLKLLVKLFMTLNIRMFLWFVRMTCLSKYGARLNYELSSVKIYLITNIKKVMSW